MSMTIQHQTQALRRGNYVLLTADTLHLLLPQHEVGAAEYLEGALEAAEEPGLLKLRGADNGRRFAALSAQIKLLPQCPAGRFLITPLGDDGDGLGWCWNEVQVLIDVELPIRPVPEVLLAPGAPVSQYAEFQGKLAYLCNAQQLAAYASRWGAE